MTRTVLVEDESVPSAHLGVVGRASTGHMSVDQTSVAAAADARRPIVLLSTREVVGWTIDRPPVASTTSPSSFASIAALAAATSVGADGRGRGWCVVPWELADQWLQGEPEELEPAIANGVVVELPPRLRSGEFEIAVHLLASTRVPACFTFDGSIDTLVSMHRRLHLGLVRFRRLPIALDDGSDLKARLDQQIIRALHDTGVPVVVDGVDDLPAADALQAAGISFAQGSWFDATVDRSDTP